MKAAVLWVVLLSACTSSDNDIATRTFVNKEQHYRIEAPTAWQLSDAHGLAQLTSAKLRKHAIVVRVAERPASLGEGRPGTDAALFGETERVLRDLPSAKLASKAPVTGSEIPGVTFDLTFAPHIANGRYHRAHTILVGKAHLYHVIYSAPAGEPIQWDAYNAVVRSLSEES